jgi:phage FluMu protein Com
MSLSGNTHTIACGSCKVAAQTVANPKSNDEVTCPRCKRRDRFENVMRSVQEHVAYIKKKRLGDSLSRSTRGNRFVKFTAKPVGHRSFRWIALGV